MLRALRRGARESDALRSAGSWLGWRDCLTTLNVGSAPRVIRTPDLLIRSQTLYPTELWARGCLLADLQDRARQQRDSSYHTATGVGLVARVRHGRRCSIRRST